MADFRGVYLWILENMRDPGFINVYWKIFLVVLTKLKCSADIKEIKGIIKEGIEY